EKQKPDDDHRQCADDMKEHGDGDGAVDVEEVELRQDDLTRFVKSADAARRRNRESDGRDAGDEESRIERQRTMQRRDDERELGRQTAPHAHREEDDARENRGLANEIDARGERVEEVHPRLAKTKRKNASDELMRGA